MLNLIQNHTFNIFNLYFALKVKTLDYMEIQGVMINDAKSNMYFAFISQFPGICAQGKTKEEVDEKIHKYFQSYVDRMQNASIKFTENDVF